MQEEDVILKEDMGYFSTIKESTCHPTQIPIIKGLANKINHTTLARIVTEEVVHILQEVDTTIIGTTTPILINIITTINGSKIGIEGAISILTRTMQSINNQGPNIVSYNCQQS